MTPPSNSGPIRKLPRRMMKVGRRLSVALKRIWLPLIYPGLTLGRGVEVGRRVRFIAADRGRIEIGDGTIISDDSYVVTGPGGVVSIGARVHVSPWAMIASCRQIEIGDDTLVGERVTIRDQNHGIDQSAGLYRDQPAVTEPIKIGPNAWIGANSVVLSGVTIGANAIVAAGAVVNRDVDTGDLVGGVPARVIRSSSQSS